MRAFVPSVTSHYCTALRPSSFVIMFLFQQTLTLTLKVYFGKTLTQSYVSSPQLCCAIELQDSNRGVHLRYIHFIVYGYILDQHTLLVPNSLSVNRYSCCSARSNFNSELNTCRYSFVFTTSSAATAQAQINCRCLRVMLIMIVRRIYHSLHRISMFKQAALHLIDLQMLTPLFWLTQQILFQAFYSQYMNI